MVCLVFSLVYRPLPQTHFHLSSWRRTGNGSIPKLYQSIHIINSTTKLADKDCNRIPELWTLRTCGILLEVYQIHTGIQKAKNKYLRSLTSEWVLPLGVSVHRLYSAYLTRSEPAFSCIIPVFFCYSHTGKYHNNTGQYWFHSICWYCLSFGLAVTATFEQPYNILGTFTRSTFLLFLHKCIVCWEHSLPFQQSHDG